MLIRAIPILPVREMQATICFYQNNLGFKAINLGNCIILKNGEVELQLDLIPINTALINIKCCIYVTNIEDHFSELSSKDLVSPNGLLQKKYGGIKEFFILDNNGNTLQFREKSKL